MIREQDNDVRHYQCVVDGNEFNALRIPKLFGKYIDIGIGYQYPAVNGPCQL